MPTEGFAHRSPAVVKGRPDYGVDEQLIIIRVRGELCCKLTVGEPPDQLAIGGSLFVDVEEQAEVPSSHIYPCAPI